MIMMLKKHKSRNLHENEITTLTVSNYARHSRLLLPPYPDVSYFIFSLNHDQSQSIVALEDASQKDATCHVIVELNPNERSNLNESHIQPNVCQAARKVGCKPSPLWFQSINSWTSRSQGTPVP